MNLLEASKKAVEKLSLSELMELSSHLRERISARSRSEIRYGDLVECQFRGGEVIRFRVDRINPSGSVSGMEEGGRRRKCRAPLTQCRLVGKHPSLADEREPPISSARAKPPTSAPIPAPAGFGDF